ncbi:hypothetical protein GCM10008961_31280 [Deinococcus knuensis]|uniref:Uncharacterized protein n=1 Tax=Deinococcus knuensis TaxID=1837380 RepID=A0ABQ2SR51_9DEIO|nr:hypothetical protein GCM10008961_31280 [Deinococcus knuensis]
MPPVAVMVVAVKRRNVRVMCGGERAVPTGRAWGVGQRDGQLRIVGEHVHVHLTAREAVRPAAPIRASRTTSRERRMPLTSARW